MSNHSETELYYIQKTMDLQAQMPEYIKQYIRSIKTRTSPRTRYEYLKDIQQFLTYLSAKNNQSNITLSDLSDLKKTDFEEYLEYIEHYKIDQRNITNGRTSLKRKLSSLRNLFAYLFENELIRSDEIRKIQMPKLHRKEIIRLDDTDAGYFLNAVENGTNLTKKQRDYYDIQSVRDRAIIYLLLSTGLRVSECVELDLNDIDMEKKCVHIVRKGGDEAIVYFSDEAAEYLTEWLDSRKNNKKIPKEETALFISSQRKRLCVRSVENIVKKYAMRSVPLKHITPHKLRATYATNLYDATGDIYLVAETLGHKDVKTTKEHYANMSDKHKEKNRNMVTFKTKTNTTDSE